MQLLIMRHGEAASHSVDQERTLTDFGRQQAAETAARIADSAWRPAKIWSSPYVRARQTAAIVSEILNCPVEEKAFITPEDDPGLCLNALLENQQWPLLLVSHMPLVGTLSTLLIDGHREGVAFATAQATVLDMPVVGPGCADLKTRFVP